MRWIYVCKWLFITAICLVFADCQQMADEEIWAENEGTLKVKARSLSNEGVVYPLRVYAFSSDYRCVASQMIESEDVSVKLQLPPDKYRIVLFAGGEGAYVFPDEVDWQGEVRMKSAGGAEVPLMAGMADVHVSAESDSKVELTLVNMVSAVDVELTNLPHDVASVTMTMSSFYQSMSMSGEYGDGSYSLEVDCVLDTANVWRAKTCYVFPSSTPDIVFSFRIKMKNGKEITYGYTWGEKMEANSPYHIRGKFASGITLEGMLNVQDWNKDEHVDFEFGDQPPSDDEEEEQPEEGLLSLPEVGTIWNGAIVASIGESDETGVDLLLMSLDEWDVDVSQVADLEAGYSVNGISGWRLPTSEEAQLLRSTFNGDSRIELNEKITDYDSSLVGVDGEERYLCTKSGTYYSYVFTAGTTITKAGTKRSYYARLVKTFRMLMK